MGSEDIWVAVLGGVEDIWVAVLAEVGIGGEDILAGEDIWVAVLVGE